MPGGGIDPGETPAEAAIREAWEEVGAHVEVMGEPFTLHGQSGMDAECFPMRLLRLEASPEGRAVRWVNVRSVWWASDPQLRQGLSALGRPVPSAQLAGRIRRIHRLGWKLKARFRR